MIENNNVAKNRSTKKGTVITENKLCKLLMLLAGASAVILIDMVTPNLFWFVVCSGICYAIIHFGVHD